MRDLYLVLALLWVVLLLWRILADPYPPFLPYGLIAVIGLGVAAAFVNIMQRLGQLPEALLNRLEAR